MANISYQAVARLIAEAKSRKGIDPQAIDALTDLTWALVDYATTARHELDLDEFLFATLYLSHPKLRS